MLARQQPLAEWQQVKPSQNWPTAFWQKHGINRNHGFYGASSTDMQSKVFSHQLCYC